MPKLQQLSPGQAQAVLAFELANRAYFAAVVSDRGDEYFDQFAERHRALLAEQEAGDGAYYVLVAGDGSVLGRFNLYRSEDGTAELGYRVAQHAAGRGLATAAVRQLCRLAADRHGLRRLRAATSRENTASQRVLAKAGFVPAGPADPADIGGKQGTWYQRDLTAGDEPPRPAAARDQAPVRRSRDGHGRGAAVPVRIVHLPAAAFRALADGDLAAANTVSPVPLTEYFVSPEWRGTWRMRSEQVGQDPASAAWVTGVIWDEQAQAAVGRAGYHGPPDDSGMVEIGYSVDPACRRRGYARAALEALLQRAAREPQVSVVRVTISPDNTASYALAAQYGFAEVGEQWDEEDGLEIIYEVAASRDR